MNRSPWAGPEAPVQAGAAASDLWQRPYLTVKQVSWLLQLSINSIYTMANKRYPAGVWLKVGAQWRAKSQELALHLEELVHEAERAGQEDLDPVDEPTPV